MMDINKCKKLISRYWILVIPISLFSIALLFRIFVGTFIDVVGDSMSPAFTTNDCVFSTVVRRGTELKKGDVVIFERNEEKTLIKRIAAVEGDIVYAALLDKEGFPEKDEDGNIMFDEETSIEIGEDEYYVLGDNATESFDSRYFGVIKRSCITYKCTSIKTLGIVVEIATLAFSAAIVFLVFRLYSSIPQLEEDEQKKRKVNIK